MFRAPTNTISRIQGIKSMETGLFVNGFMTSVTTPASVKDTLAPVAQTSIPKSSPRAGTNLEAWVRAADGTPIRVANCSP